MRLPRLLSVALLGLFALAVAGCNSTSKKKDYPVSVVRFLLEADSPAGGVLVRLPRSGVAITVEPKSRFTEYDIVTCEVVDNEFGKSLAFSFTDAAARDLFRTTVPAQGKRIVTTVNGVPLGARMIEAPLSQGYLVTYLEVPEAELEPLAKNITKTSKDARKDMENKQR